jgi:hypothetical protein
MKQILTVLALTFVVIFQNCSQAEFGSNVKFEAVDKASPPDGDAPSDDGTPSDDNPTDDNPDDGDAPNPSPTPAPTPSTPTTPCPGRSCDNDRTPPPSDDAPSGTGIVECVLGGPSVKVVLSETFQPGSNARRTRVCMTQNACLVLLNTYTTQRGCTLNSGAPTTPDSTAQCTGIFPGSRGTCKHAQVVTDEQLSAILTGMAESF